MIRPDCSNRFIKSVSLHVSEAIAQNVRHKQGRKQAGKMYNYYSAVFDTEKRIPVNQNVPCGNECIVITPPGIVRPRSTSASKLSYCTDTNEMFADCVADSDLNLQVARLHA
jgi:hypothetical protein